MKDEPGEGLSWGQEGFPAGCGRATSNWARKSVCVVQEATDKGNQRGKKREHKQGGSLCWTLQR